MESLTLNVRVDANDKKRFEQFCSNVGMNVSTAVNMFIKAVLREKELPFKVACDIPNAETIAAFEEGEEILNNPDSPKFSSVNALFEELDS